MCMAVGPSISHRIEILWRVDGPHGNLPGDPTIPCPNTVPFYVEYLNSFYCNGLRNPRGTSVLRRVCLLDSPC